MSKLPNLKRALKNLQTLQNASVQVGWFAEKKAKPGKLTAPQLARILSEGAHLKGGQPYFFNKAGELVFMKRTGDGSKPKGAMGVTKSAVIPPRPMLAQASGKSGKEWLKKAGIIAKNVTNGKTSAREALAQLGLVMEADIRDTMYHGDFAPNSPLTIKHKEGRDTPLIDTGALAKSVTSIVNGGKE